MKRILRWIERSVEASTPIHVLAELALLHNSSRAHVCTLDFLTLRRIEADRQSEHFHHL